ncbi:FKBP-type peptidyl-prolyl cis-trans isomerase [Paucibacter sp. JuS9]|uniref:FKBP-type peptidyl-prolyl cis-trans isomerase n=1 Tax=Roseateles TaxID=93681 RepID=UPI002FE531D3
MFTKSLISRRATLSALALGLALSACGGGGGDGGSSGNSDPYGWSSVTALKTTDIKVGTGATIATANAVMVHYTGWLYDQSKADFKGTKFDSSVDRNKPEEIVFGMGLVIKGWDQGLVGMKVGGKRQLIIPASLGYGSAGKGSIPGAAALVFDVELLSIN